MDVPCENAVPASTIGIVINYRPMYTQCMIERKAAMFRLYPSPEQYAQMAQIAGACRFVYTLALEQRRDWYRPGRKFSFASQCREATALRAEVEWLKAAPVYALQQALRDLDRAISAPSRCRAEPVRGSLPSRVNARSQNQVYRHYLRSALTWAWSLWRH